MIFRELLFLLLLALIFLPMSIKVVREDYRIVIFRLSHFFKIAGPGIVMTIPFIDKITRVYLTEAIPGWQTLSVEILNEKIKHMVLYKMKPM